MTIRLSYSALRKSTDIIVEISNIELDTLNNEEEYKMKVVTKVAEKLDYLINLRCHHIAIGPKKLVHNDPS